MSKPILGEAPRDVSGGVVAAMTFGHPATQGGFLMVAFGLIFALVFVRDSELISDHEQRGRAWSTAPGEVTSAASTAGKESGRRIWAIGYRFSLDGRERQGISYRFGGVATGTPVTVEYLADDPTISRIQGMRRRKFHQAVAFVLIVPVIGLLVAGIGMLLGRRELRLLRHGTVAYGKVVSMTPTNVRINKRPVMKIELDVPSASGTQRVTCRTHRIEHAQDDAVEQVIFAPGRPERAVLVDAMVRVKVAEDGRIVSRFPAALSFIAPAVAVAAWAAAAVLVL